MGGSKEGELTSRVLEGRIQCRLSALNMLGREDGRDSILDDSLSVHLYSVIQGAVTMRVVWGMLLGRDGMAVVGSHRGREERRQHMSILASALPDAIYVDAHEVVVCDAVEECLVKVKLMMINRLMNMRR